MEAGTSNYMALVASFGFGLINFIFSWPAIVRLRPWERTAMEKRMQRPLKRLTYLSGPLIPLDDVPCYSSLSQT